MFPVSGFKEKQRAKKYRLCEATAVKEIFNELNKELRNHNTSFVEMHKGYLKIQKPSRIVRLVKKNIEGKVQETCVER